MPEEIIKDLFEPELPTLTKKEEDKASTVKGSMKGSVKSSVKGSTKK